LVRRRTFAPPVEFDGAKLHFSTATHLAGNRADGILKAIAAGCTPLWLRWRWGCQGRHPATALRTV